MVEYDEDSVDVRYVPLMTARPPEEIFSRSVLERRRNRGDQVDRGSGFVEKLQDLRATFLNQGDSLKLIDDAIRLADPGREVASEARYRIEKVRKEAD